MPESQASAKPSICPSLRQYYPLKLGARRACRYIAMLFETASGNVIYYTEFGSAAAPPLLLIHGSTLTGELDYVVNSDIAQRFATDFRVIVPDCQGHGRSDAVWLDAYDDEANGDLADDDLVAGALDEDLALGNGKAPHVLLNPPTLNYSFSDMAADLADLLVGLNASPACIAGHSNGGNVALYMAKEQSEHVRAAVLLAANAYIDDHVRTRVPINMHPDRVERERPEWMREMVELHDTHHGDGYWRELLLATVAETITNPDWQKEDLADVRVPCLVVQGENDATNAPGRHAQVLHDWLPGSELWMPPGVGHSVHWEVPDEFEQRVRAFFAAKATAPGVS